jgi:hypothetical protein
MKFDIYKFHREASPLTFGARGLRERHSWPSKNQMFEICISYEYRNQPAHHYDLWLTSSNRVINQGGHRDCTLDVKDFSYERGDGIAGHSYGQGRGARELYLSYQGWG